MIRSSSRIVLGVVFALFVGGVASAQDCAGDCGGNGEVSLGDVQSSFNVFLGTAAFNTCSDADTNRSGEVSLGEVQTAFNEFLNGCGAGPTVGNFVSQIFVAGFGTLAQMQQGQPPPPSGAPAPTVQGSTTVVNGGSSQVMVESDEGFNRLFLGVQSGGGGTGAGTASALVPGFLRLDLPQFVNGLAIVITTAQDVPVDSFSWVIQIADRLGRVSAPATTAVEVVHVGTGDVQVSVSWDADSDVDLHVVEPSGEEIYYASKLSATGGTLDLDSNAGCAIDSVRNENVTWPSGQAPHGQYIVRLDYWSSCDAVATRYIVTVQVAGQAPMTFSGTFDGPGDQGVEGDGVEITRFVF